MNFSYGWNVETEQLQSLNETDFPGFTLFKPGRHKNLYDFGDVLLIVATDRCSSGPTSQGENVPGLGQVRNKLSAYWFRKLSVLYPNHFISADINDFPEPCRRYAEQLDGPSMLVKKTTPLSVKCAVRGYMTGSGWQEYQKTGAMAGISLPPGMVESQRLPGPLFVPSLKGADQGTGFKSLEEYCGRRLAENLRNAALNLYFKAWKMARYRGVLLVESTFEFGLHEGVVHLIDECNTLETGRFWDVETYKVGSSLPWLGEAILVDAHGNQRLGGGPQKAYQNYLDLYLRLTGQKP